jgi:hypothetical protein
LSVLEPKQNSLIVRAAARAFGAHASWVPRQAGKPLVVYAEYADVAVPFADADLLAADAAARSADAVADASTASCAYAAADAAAFAAFAYRDKNLIWESLNRDLGLLQERSIAEVVESALWPVIPLDTYRTFSGVHPMPYRLEREWLSLGAQLLRRGPRWQIWIEWYEDVLNGRPPWGLPRESGNRVSFEFLTWPDEKWLRDPDEINAEIAALIEAERTKLATGDVPEQQIAPVRVEERDGKIAKASDRDSPLSARERDFEQWRMPVASHLDELLAGDFRPGTNHGRMRDRLTELQAHLQGSIADVKENQFKLGYGMTRFAGLISAYETGGDDMPVLSPDTLKDLIVLDAGLRMGLDKLERWAAFREAAANDRSGAADAPAGEVAKVLDSMAGTMEKNETYFDPELPESIRWVSEALKDPGGASRSAVFGGVRSAENVFIFLAQRALGLVKAPFDGAEIGLRQTTAAALIGLFFGIGVQLSVLAPGAVPWLKPVLEAIQKIAP